MESGERGSILIVEDQAFLASIEGKQLEGLGFRVRYASSGEEALETLRRGDPPPDLVVMDVELGRGMDGIQAAEAILKIRRLPVVFSTSHTDSETIGRIEGVSPYGYVYKKAGLFVLESSVKMALRLFSAHRQLEARVEEVEALLEEKELILREVHHRIKNNLNAVAGLLSMKEAGSGSPEAAAALREAISQVEAMGLLYDKLYRTDPTGELDAGEYLPRLAREALALFPRKKELGLETSIPGLRLDAKRLANLGIILTELLTNSLKYAVPATEAPRIYFSLAEEEGRLRFRYEDNGPGLSGDGAPETEGFGLRLVEGLARQLGGRMEIEGGGGARFRISFPR